MNRITNYGKLAIDITNWIKNYATTNNIKSLVVGVSGGMDSAVVSTLCAMTGIETCCCIIDIESSKEHLYTAVSHIDWLEDQYKRVLKLDFDLSDTYLLYSQKTMLNDLLISANSKSRLRMMTLYTVAGQGHGVVVGTGNKVEDFGVGFYTKYGDGGVDISPIADLYKTEVRELGRYLGISQEILDAAPTDGLWADGRTDEDQIGATYEELEWAMDYDDFCLSLTEQLAYSQEVKLPFEQLTDRQQDVVKIYRNLNRKNQHKMQPIPIYKLPL